MTEPEPRHHLPPATPPDPDPPAVLPVAPAPPQPGFWMAVLLTVGFAVVLFGTLLGVVVVACVWLAVTRGLNVLQPVPGAKEGSVASIAPAVVEALAVSFPLAYAAGLVYTLVVFRAVIGRGWTRQVGLRRLPLFHLGVGLLALPGFVLLSDGLAKLLFDLFGMGEAAEQSAGELGALFESFHWSFAVLAVGVGPGIVEELWCRGFLGRGLVGRYGWAAGVVLTSLFFGCLHVFPPPYVLVTAVMGAVLHFTYATSRSLWVPITVHLLNNSFAALASVGVIPTAGMDQALANDAPLVYLLAGGLLLSAGLAMWTARGRPVPADPDAPAVLPDEGVMVPPPSSGVAIVHDRPNPLFALAALGSSVALVWLLRG